MRTAWLLAILLCAQFTPSLDRDPVKLLAGCYELRVLPTRPPDLVKKPLLLPRKFQLASEHTKSFGFVAKNLDPKVEWDLPISFWTAKDTDSVQISWGTGYVGYTVLLKRSGETFRGNADYFDDTGGHDSRDVVAKTVNCDQPKK